MHFAGTHFAASRVSYAFARPVEDFARVLEVQVARTRAAEGREEARRRRATKRTRNRGEEKEDAVRGAVARDAQTARGCAKLRPAC